MEFSGVGSFSTFVVFLPLIYCYFYDYYFLLLLLMFHIIIWAIGVHIGVWCIDLLCVAYNIISIYMPKTTFTHNNFPVLFIICFLCILNINRFYISWWFYLHNGLLVVDRGLLHAEYNISTLFSTNLKNICDEIEPKSIIKTYSSSSSSFSISLYCTHQKYIHTQQCGKSSMRKMIIIIIILYPFE